MCGVAGAFAGDGLVARAAVLRMTAASVHRGPDDEGFDSFTSSAGTLALGFRRLAIQDLSSAGHQPMTLAETGDTIVFNGEIYNFRELRAELEASGAVFRSRSDTEVILHAFARWGTEAFARLYGMFAFALYRAKDKRLFLVRDALGIKPLYVACGGDTLSFASEVRALRAGGLVDDTVDRRALAGFLAYGAVQAPLTILRGAKLLEPGTWVEFDLTARMPDALPAPKRFWSFASPERPAFPAKLVRDQLAARLREAVRSHLISDVPVGLFLSSGIDSTALALLASEIRGGDVDAFTVTLGGDRNDEAPVAARTARRLGIRFHDVSVPEPAVLALVEKWLAAVDQPSVDGLNTYIVSRAVRERGIVVALSGLGGDEIFGGYSTFREVPRLLQYAQAAKWVPPALRGGAANLLVRGRPAVQRRKAYDLAVNTSPTLRSVYMRRRRLLSDEEMAALGFSARELGLDADFLPPESEPDRWTWPEEFPFGSVRVLESRFYMGNMLLRDSDVFGMANGLELRVPLLDRRVIDLALKLPGDAWLDRKGPNKPLLVSAVGGMPAEVLSLAKRGFSLPQARWMSGPLSDLFVASLEEAGGSGLLDPAAVRGVWRDFEQDREGPTWSRAWALGVFGHWLSREPAEPPASLPAHAKIA